MKNGVSSSEVKTGAFVLVCIFILLGILIQVGSVNLFEKGYVLKAKFYNLDGVKVHSVVRLSGLDVGQVRGIKMIYDTDTYAECDLWIAQSYKVRSDSTAIIATMGLMGEKYVQIVPGKGEGATYAAQGQMLNSKEPASMDDLIKTVQESAEHFNQMADEITKMSSDFRTLVPDAKKLLQDSNRTVNNIDSVVGTNKAKLDKTFDYLESTAKNFKDFSQDLKYHPWKILFKGKEKTRAQMNELDGTSVPVTQTISPSAEVRSTQKHSTTKQNFGPKRL